jgi:hypothetical protein
MRGEAGWRHTGRSYQAPLMLAHQNGSSAPGIAVFFWRAAATPTLRAIPVAPIAGRVGNRGHWYQTSRGPARRSAPDRAITDAAGAAIDQGLLSGAAEEPVCHRYGRFARFGFIGQSERPSHVGCRSIRSGNVGPAAVLRITDRLVHCRISSAANPASEGTANCRQATRQAGSANHPGTTGLFAR